MLYILIFNCFRAFASILAEPFSLIPSISAISLCEYPSMQNILNTAR